jgi:uncharacterized protein
MVHQYQLNGYNIVLDGCSGAVHAVDEVAYDVIALYRQLPAGALKAKLLEKYAARPDVTDADLDACLADVAALEKAGKLFSPDTFAPMAGTLKARSAGIVKALCLHVAHTCNLNCAYCFASQGKYHGERALMSFEVGRQALEFLIAHAGARHNLEVDFFGGEPLMNWAVVKQLVAYARGREADTGKHFRFTLTTNGMLIDDDVIDFCNREMSNVVLSLDGRKRDPRPRARRLRGQRQLGAHRAQIPEAGGRPGRQKLLHARHLHPREPGFHKGRVRDGRPRLHRAEHGARGLRAGRPRRADPRRTCPSCSEQYELLAKEMLRGEKAGRADHLLPLYDRPDRRPLHLQAHLGLRLRHGVHGRDALGRPVPLPPVRGRGALQAGQHLGRRDQRRRAGRNSSAATPIPGRSARTAGRGCTAPAGARRTRTTPPARCWGVYEYGCELFKKRIECALMMQVARSLAAENA